MDTSLDLHVPESTAVLDNETVYESNPTTKGLQVPDLTAVQDPEPVVLHGTGPATDQVSKEGLRVSPSPRPTLVKVISKPTFFL